MGTEVGLDHFLVVSAILLVLGIFGIFLNRKNVIVIMMSIELMLLAVNLNLVAFGAFNQTVTGQIFALFVIAIAAAEVGVGLAIVLLIYRNRRSVDLTGIDSLKG